MAIPSNKNELLDEISNNFDKLYAKLVSISAIDAQEARLEGHAKNTILFPDSRYQP